MNKAMGLQAYNQRLGHDIDGVRPVMIPSDDGVWFSRSEVELAFRSNGMTDEDKQQIVEEYDAAMCASNEAGYAGITAAETIRYLIQRAEAAEEEIARRDAAASERAGIVEVWPGTRSCDFLLSRPLPVGQHNVYTTAQPAVLPPEMINADAPCHYSSEESFAWVAGANWMREQCFALGAQQQKVVELPTSFTVIGENIRSQNNRCTADPIFCVFEKVPTPAAEGYNHTRIEWYDSDHDRDATPLQAARLEALFDGGRCNDNDYKCWRRLAMHDVDTFVTACFTFKGCEDYLTQNGHNLRQPFVYVTSAYRNDEYKAVREWLMQLAAAPAPGGDAE